MSEIVNDTTIARDGISVVIPFYKNIEWLKTALKSIDDQTLLPNEIIIVDDGSNEDLSSLRSRVGKLLIVKQKNAGAAAARNKGILLSQYKYIAFLDSDDYWHPQKLEEQYKHMKKNHAMWSFHRYTKFSNEMEIKSNNMNCSTKIKKIFPGIANSCNIGTPCVMVDRDVFREDIVKFNVDLKFGEDACLWFLLASRYPVLFLDGAFCFVRMHGNNAAYNVMVQLTARRDLWRFLCYHNLNNKLRPITRMGYTMCSFFSTVLESGVISRFGRTMKEFMAKMFYIIPWIMFKIDFIIAKPL